MKVKGYKGSGKLMICIPSKLYKELPAYFEIELDEETIKEREKGK